MFYDFLTEARINIDLHITLNVPISQPLKSLTDFY